MLGLSTCRPLKTTKKTTKRPAAKLQHPARIAGALVEARYKKINDADDVSVVYDLMEARNSALWNRLQQALGSDRGAMAVRVKLENKLAAALPRELQPTRVEDSDMQVDEEMTAAFAAFTADRAYQRRLGRELTEFAQQVLRAPAPRERAR